MDVDDQKAKEGADKLLHVPVMVICLNRHKEHKSALFVVLTRPKGLTTIVAISLCSVLYLVWLLPRLPIRSGFIRPSLLFSTNTTENKIPPNTHPRRLIVFGDSWSDDRQYHIDPPLANDIPDWKEQQGKVWTEWLCFAVNLPTRTRRPRLTIKQISCAHHDNFARSSAKSLDDRYTGAVVDSSLLDVTLANKTSVNETATAAYKLGFGEPLADLKTQVQQWLKFEKQQYASSRVSQLERSGTVFTMWFSLWDLWYYSERDLDDAESAVTRTMDSLFEQLDVIADNWPSDIKVILPEAIDATFLPGWHTIRTGPNGSDPNADTQRSAVMLVEQWNQALDMQAGRWERGSVYIYNTNEWLLDQVREQQLYEAQLSDANGMGATKPPWANVRSGCVQINKTEGDLTAAVQCSNPKEYLFW